MSGRNADGREKGRRRANPGWCDEPGGFTGDFVSPIPLNGGKWVKIITWCSQGDGNEGKKGEIGIFLRVKVGFWGQDGGRSDRRGHWSHDKAGGHGLSLCVLTLGFDSPVQHPHPRHAAGRISTEKCNSLQTRKSGLFYSPCPHRIALSSHEGVISQPLPSPTLSPATPGHRRPADAQDWGFGLGGSSSHFFQQIQAGIAFPGMGLG